MSRISSIRYSNISVRTMVDSAHVATKTIGTANTRTAAANVKTATATSATSLVMQPEAVSKSASNHPTVTPTSSSGKKLPTMNYEEQETYYNDFVKSDWKFGNKDYSNIAYKALFSCLRIHGIIKFRH